MKTPRCSRKLRGNFRANAPCGVAIATSIHCAPSAVPGLPRQEVRLNRWHENSKAVFPPTNPAHVPASSPRWRAMQRALKVARARSTVVCSCDALSARASGGASAPGQPRSGFRGVALDATSSIFDRPCDAIVPQRGMTAHPHKLFPAAAHPARRAVRSSGPAVAGPLPKPCSAPVLGILLHARQFLPASSGSAALQPPPIPDFREVLGGHIFLLPPLIEIDIL